MSQRDLEAIAGPWAAQVVERYANRARPKMSEDARLVLLDHIMRRLAPVIATTSAGDWPDVVNAALDNWEDEARTSGPRVRAFDERAEVVRLHGYESGRTHALGTRLHADNRPRTMTVRRRNAWLGLGVPGRTGRPVKPPLLCPTQGWTRDFDISRAASLLQRPPRSPCASLSSITATS